MILSFLVIIEKSGIPHHGYRMWVFKYHITKHVLHISSPVLQQTNFTLQHSLDWMIKTIVTYMTYSIYTAHIHTNRQQLNYIYIDILFLYF